MESRPIFDNLKEALVLLDLIDSEFRSDPKSTQCFDQRIVDRVHRCVEDAENLGIVQAIVAADSTKG